VSTNSVEMHRRWTEAFRPDPDRLALMPGHSAPDLAGFIARQLKTTHTKAATRTEIS